MAKKICSIPNCTGPAEADSEPPLCPIHLDIDTFIFTLDQRKKPVTVEAVQDLAERGKANGGMITITHEQIAELLPGFLARRGNGSL